MRNRSGKEILFTAPAALAADIERLTRLARTPYAGGGADGHFFDYYDQLEGACVAAVDALRRGEVASSVVEVAAAATVVALAKNYAVSGFFERATILRGERPEHRATADRVALLGAASQARSDFADLRPGVAAMAGEPHADALLAIMDVAGAGSRPRGSTRSPRRTRRRSRSTGSRRSRRGRSATTRASGSGGGRSTTCSGPRATR